MQISVDVHNYMETLVGHVLAREEFTQRFDHDQLADLACLALNQLRPVYIRFDVDFLSALPEERLVALKEYAETAVSSAVSLIVDDRRKNRKDEIPVIINKPRFDDDLELEWFEKPIVSMKSRK
ncbi:late competence development ComFB family protein [Vibrio cholerae]